MGHEPIDHFAEHGTRDRRDETEPVPDPSGVVTPADEFRPDPDSDLSAGDPDVADESDGSGSTDE